MIVNKKEPLFHKTEENFSPQGLVLSFSLDELIRIDQGVSFKNNTPKDQLYRLEKIFTDSSCVKGRLNIIGRKIILPDQCEAKDIALYISEAEEPASELSVGKSSGGSPSFVLQLETEQFRDLISNLNYRLMPTEMRVSILAKNVLTEPGKIIWKKSDPWESEGYAQNNEDVWEVVNWQILYQFTSRDFVEQRQHKELTNIKQKIHDIYIIIVMATFLLAVIFLSQIGRSL